MSIRRRSTPDRSLLCGAALALAPLMLAPPLLALEPITGCEPVGRARPICGFQHPEDLALLPDGRTLLVSEYGNIEGTQPGNLVGFDTRSEKRALLWKGGQAGVRAPTPGWGDSACPGPPDAAFSPHGIHLDRRDDGRLQLLAVQHGGRESVEFFEVGSAPGGAWQLTWRGCAVPPPGSFLNDVVALPGGGLAVTHMMPLGSGTRGVIESLPDRPEGYVLEWQPGPGWKRIPGSETSVANGIERSPDGAILYVDSSGGNELFALERASGRVLRRVPMPLPDNSTWAPDGRLLVASLVAGIQGTNLCQTIGGRACPSEFQILAVDVATGATEVLYRHQGAPMGAGTVGLRVGDALYMGSFAGDRLVRLELPAR